MVPKLVVGQGEFCVFLVQPQSYAGHMGLGLSVKDFLMFLLLFSVTKFHNLSVVFSCGKVSSCRRRSLSVLDLKSGLKSVSSPTCRNSFYSLYSSRSKNESYLCLGCEGIYCSQ